MTFIYWKGGVGRRFAGALAERARAGVRVRILLDGWGSRPIERSLISDMEGAGATVRWFRPVRRLQPGKVNHRTHRKVLVVDESCGFTGGVGISDLWEGDARNASEWRDTHFRVRGPCVDGLRAAFLDNWAETDSSLFDASRDRFPMEPSTGRSIVQCVRGASETGLSDVSTLLRTLLKIAEQSIRITTAYFVPSAELTDELCAAAGRGVAIQILLPGPHADKRFVQMAAEARYSQLLDLGVEIWSYQPSMLHAKITTVDGCLACIGSANFNQRSTACDEEVNLVVLDPCVTATLDAQFECDVARSVRIQPDRWHDRMVLQRAAEAITTPLRRWF